MSTFVSLLLNVLRAKKTGQPFGSSVKSAGKYMNLLRAGENIVNQQRPQKARVYFARQSTFNYDGFSPLHGRTRMSRRVKGTIVNRD